MSLGWLNQNSQLVFSAHNLLEALYRPLLRSITSEPSLLASISQVRIKVIRFAAESKSRETHQTQIRLRVVLYVLIANQFPPIISLANSSDFVFRSKRLLE